MGYYTNLGITLISWSAKKKSIIARSSIEVEYHALVALTTYIIWLRHLSSKFQVPLTQPTSIYSNVIFSIYIGNNLIFYTRSKHIEIDHHFIREHIISNEISIQDLSSHDQVANIFTKSLP